MKYDVAKNEDGPLRKTVHSKDKLGGRVDGGDDDETRPAGRKRPLSDVEKEPSVDRYPGLDERLRDIETHLAVRYGEP